MPGGATRIRSSSVVSAVASADVLTGSSQAVHFERQSDGGGRPLVRTPENIEIGGGGGTKAGA